MSDDEPMRCSDPTCTKLHPPRALATHAVAALVAVQRGQRRHGLIVLSHIAQRWGAHGMIWSARMWCQLTVRYTDLKDAEVDRFDGLAFITLDESGAPDADVAVQDVDEVEAGWRWAGRFLMAVKFGDTDQLEALVATVEHDAEAMTDAVTHLLLACGAAMANPSLVLTEAGGS